jgi:hypothetical protein
VDLRATCDQANYTWPYERPLGLFHASGFSILLRPRNVPRPSRYSKCRAQASCSRVLRSASWRVDLCLRTTTTSVPIERDHSRHSFVHHLSLPQYWFLPAPHQSPCGGIISSAWVRSCVGNHVGSKATSGPKGASCCVKPRVTSTQPRRNVWHKRVQEPANQRSRAPAGAHACNGNRVGCAPAAPEAQRLADRPGN